MKCTGRPRPAAPLANDPLDIIDRVRDVARLHGGVVASRCTVITAWIIAWIIARHARRMASRMGHGQRDPCSIVHRWLSRARVNVGIREFDSECKELV
jgi:hypothetical protein